MFYKYLKTFIVQDLKHSTLYTLNSTLILYTQHSTLYTLHFTLYILHSTHYTLHSTLYTLHSTLYTLHSTLCTLHSTFYTLHSALYTHVLQITLRIINILNTTHLVLTLIYWCALESVQCKSASILNYRSTRTRTHDELYNPLY